MNVSIDAVREAFAAWKNEPFPPQATLDIDDELFGKLAEYDGYVAGLVAHVAAGSTAPFDLTPNREIRQRFLASGSPSALAYLDGLEDLLALAAKVRV